MTLHFSAWKKVIFQVILVAAIVRSASVIVPAASAQTNISGDLSGSVMDPSGAAIPGASVTVTSKATGASKTVTTGSRGEYRVPLLSPGDYDLSFAATGFEGARTSIAVAAGQIATGDVKLTIGKASTTVDVTTAEPLLHTEDAQISTSFTMEQIQALPNPGNDLTFIAQTSPGAVMNTMGGQGNFSVFGLPATSNTFTVNGGYQNDPFLNLNNSGATNLLLGNNDVADVTVISNAYDAAFGGLGGAQVNEISRSGSNSFHGNGTYWWNGRVLNANDWFNKAAGSPRSFDNVNQYAAAIGGPIVKDKAFWFVNYEGLRVVLPVRDTVFAPSQGTQTAILSQIPASETPLYQNIFAQYNNAPGIGSAKSDPADPRFIQFNGVAGNFTHEYLVSGRTDFNLSATDKAFIHFKVDKGLQATSTSLLNPVFNADSPQPEYSGEMQETHTFTPDLANQFLFAAEYYRALFVNTRATEANALVPFTLVFFDSDLAGNPSGNVNALPGGLDTVFPQGRNVTNYQFADDLSWTKSNHTVKLGFTMRRDDVTDFNPQVGTTATAIDYFSDFEKGNVDIWSQTFPSRGSQPITVYNMGAYLQDQWKALPNLTITYGLRLEHNSNPTCLTNCFGYTNGDFYSLPTASDPVTGLGTTPFNSLLTTGHHRAFEDLQHVGYGPRFGFAWLPFGAGSTTTVRGGFGLFVDTFPATVADSLLSNLPLSVSTSLFGPHYGGPNYLLDPTQPNSAGQAAASFASMAHACFASGCSADSIGLQPNVLTAAHRIQYPAYDEYNLAVEHQITRNTALSVSYVGNHGYHEPVVDNSANAFNAGPAFNGLPTSAPNRSFASGTIIYAGATSNYNGLITTVTHRERYVTLQLNYAYSHALDEISNGGFLSFSGNGGTPINPYNLSQNYGNADYDTRQYVSGSYVITVPHWRGPSVLVDNWEVAGTLFHNTGYPFSVVDGLTGGNFQNYGGGVLAQQTGNSFATHCGGAQHTVVGAVPCPFAANFAQATGFGEQHRNQLFSPNYTDTDLDVTKGFKVPHWESGSVKVGAQFFNLANHPNFGFPYNNLNVGPALLGQTHNLQASPTSILGSFLGGDAGPRLIQLKARFVF